MTLENTVEGGCLCGAIRFAVAKPLAPAAYCLCSDCRKTTESAFNFSVPVSRENFSLLSGLPKPFTKAGDKGVNLTRLFFPDCGSPVYTFSDRYPDLVYIKGGAFDEPNNIIPAYQSYTSSAASWAHIPADLPGFPRDKSSST